VTESSVRRRLIGAALRRCREEAGYTLDEPARLLDCDRSKVSRIETGVRGIRPKELRELLEDYGVPAQERDTLVALARQQDRKGWWDEYAHILPPGAGEHIILESAASELMIYETQLVPDLLQTSAYAQAVAEHDPALHSDKERADAMHVLAGRQAGVIDGRHQLTVVDQRGRLASAGRRTSGDARPAGTAGPLHGRGTGRYAAGAAVQRRGPPRHQGARRTRSCGSRTPRASGSCRYRHCPPACTWTRHGHFLPS
jgi:transcriptional regulator with XRE-family HTH domain